MLTLLAAEAPLSLIHGILLTRRKQQSLTHSPPPLGHNLFTANLGYPDNGSSAIQVTLYL